MNGYMKESEHSQIHKLTKQSKICSECDQPIIDGHYVTQQTRKSRFRKIKETHYHTRCFRKFVEEYVKEHGKK